MAPLIYPEPTWSNRFGRFVRTLQVVAVAGAIGAVGGGVAVMTLVGGGNTPHQPTVLKASTADNGAAQPAVPAAPLPNAAAAAVQVAPAAAPPPASADPNPQRSPAITEASSTAAAIAQQPIQQAAAPAGASPGTDIYNRVEPEQKATPVHTRVRPKATHRIKSAERREKSAPAPADHNGWYSAQHSDGWPGDYARYSSAQRRAPYGDGGGSYTGQRYSYRDYDSPPVLRAPPSAARGFYFGGSGFYDRGGGWGN